MVEVLVDVLTDQNCRLLSRKYVVCKTCCVLRLASSDSLTTSLGRVHKNSDKVCLRRCYCGESRFRDGDGFDDWITKELAAECNGLGGVDQACYEVYIAVITETYTD